MGYFYITLALIAGLGKGFCGKKVSDDMHNFKECIFINLMRMLFCTGVGFLLAVIKMDPDAFALSTEILSVCILAAVSMSIFCVCWMYAYRNEAYMLLSIFTMLGSIVTCILDRVFYQTQIRINQWIGMIILLVAVIIMSEYNKGIKGRLTFKGLFLLILGSAGSAVADFSQKVYVREIGKSAEVFNFYMYALGFLLLLLIYMALGNKKMPRTAKILYDKHHMWVYFAMAFFLYMNSVTKTMAAGFISSVQIYPVLQGANLIASALMAHTLFKEKLNVKCIVGMATAFTGLMVIHLL